MADEGVAGVHHGPTSSKSVQIHRGASTSSELDHAYIGQLEGVMGPVSQYFAWKPRETCISKSNCCRFFLLQIQLLKQAFISSWAANGLSHTVTGVSATSSCLLLEILAWYTFCNELHPLQLPAPHSQALDRSICEAAHCGKLWRGTAFAATLTL